MIAMRNLDQMLSIPAPRPRSPAQRQASRLNGSRSRGPVTPAGKAIVAKNGMKKGLLAGMMAPAGDYTRGKLHYERIHRGLIEQYQPRDVIAHTLVEALAADLLRLARANRFDNALQQPAIPLPEADAKRLQEGERVQGLHDLLQSVAAGCRAGQPLRCTRIQAVEVTDHLAMVLSELEVSFREIEDELKAAEEQATELRSQPQHAPEAALNPQERDGITQPQEAEPKPAESPPSKQDKARHEALKADEAAETKQLQELAGILGPATERFRTPGYLAELLSGRKRFKPDDRPAIQALLNYTAENLRVWLGGMDDLLRKACNLENEHYFRLAQAPQLLMLQQAYRAGIERSIRMNIAQLERIKAPGSSR